ncbi:hypothetical protein XH87_00895 [Bradyrhizobium sp. CCBAU 53415]|nr:hypothetical protein [Bradyrhizobium sp. CCBAU 53415]
MSREESRLRLEIRLLRASNQPIMARSSAAWPTGLRMQSPRSWSDVEIQHEFVHMRRNPLLNAR